MQADSSPKKVEINQERRKNMAEEGKTYVCRLCGQEVKVTKAGVGTLVCCDQPMELEEE